MTNARRNPALVLGLVLSAAVVAIALISLVWTPHDPMKMAIVERLRPAEAICSAPTSSVATSPRC